MQKIDRQFAYLLTGRLLQALLAIGSLRLMTEILPAEQVGRQFLINSVILWFSLVLINPVGMFINRHLHEWQNEKTIYSQIKKINLYFLFVALFALIVVMIFSRSLFSGIVSEKSLLAYVFCYVFLSTWFQTLVSFFNLLNWQNYFTSFHITAQGLGLIIAVILTQLFGATAQSWLWGLLVGQIIALGLAVTVFLKKIPLSSQAAAHTQFNLFSGPTLSFCIPVALATLFMWFNSQGYRVLIEKFTGLEFLASLGVGLGVAASVASVVESVTTQYLQPKYYASLVGASPEARREAWSVLWQRSSKIYFIFSLLAAVNATFILKVITAESFHGLAAWVLFGTLLELMRQCSNVTYLAAHSERKTERNIKPYLIGSIVLLTGIFYLNKAGRLSQFDFLGLLLLSGAVTLAYNILTVKKLLNGVDFDLKGLLKFLVYGTPLCLVLVFTDSNSSFFVLLTGAVISGLWGMGLLWLALRPKNYIQHIF